MSHTSARPASGSIAMLGLLTLALSGCGEQARARPLSGQQEAATSTANHPAAHQVCGTETNPCVLEGITVVVPRNG